MQRKWIQGSFTWPGPSGREGEEEMRREGVEEPASAAEEVPEHHRVETRGWLSGAAGRLARGGQPGVSTTSHLEAVLPESLDSPFLAGEAEVEAEVEREFLKTISQSTEEVQAEMEAWLTESSSAKGGQQVRLEVREAAPSS